MHLSHLTLLLPFATASLRDYFGPTPTEESLKEYRPRSPHVAWVQDLQVESTEGASGLPVRVSALTETIHVQAEVSHWRDQSTMEESNTVSSTPAVADEGKVEESNGWGGWFHFGASVPHTLPNETLSNSSPIGRLDRILMEIPQPHRFVVASNVDSETQQDLAIKLTDFYAQCLAAAGMVGPESQPEISPSCDLPKLAQMCRLPTQGCHVAAGYLWNCAATHAVEAGCKTFVPSIIGAECNQTVGRLLLCLTGLEKPDLSIKDGLTRICQ